MIYYNSLFVCIALIFCFVHSMRLEKQKAFIPIILEKKEKEKKKEELILLTTIKQQQKNLHIPQEPLLSPQYFRTTFIESIEQLPQSTEHATEPTYQNILLTLHIQNLKREAIRCINIIVASYPSPQDQLALIEERLGKYSLSSLRDTVMHNNENLKKQGLLPITEIQVEQSKIIEIQPERKEQPQTTTQEKIILEELPPSQQRIEPITSITSLVPQEQQPSTLPATTMQQIKTPKASSPSLFSQIATFVTNTIKQITNFFRLASLFFEDPYHFLKAFYTESTRSPTELTESDTE